MPVRSMAATDLPTCRVAGWADIDGWVNRVVDKVHTSGHPPYAVVGMSRGGWIPARLVADRLGVKRLLTLQTSHWGVTATRSGKAEITQALSGRVAGEAVLIVDDITDTGESLILASDYIRREGRPSHIETATLLHITHSKLVPTYYAEEIPSDRWVWVVFPWTYWEDLRTLAARALPEGKDTDGVTRVLRERCGFAVPAREVAQALGEGPPPSSK